MNSHAPMPPAVLVDQLSVDLGGGPILSGVNLQVPDGEMVALQGANGSGKTTLVKALVGLVPRKTGRVALYGDDASVRSTVLWSQIGYVPQRVNTSPSMSATAEEVVVSGLLSNRRLRPERGSKDRVRLALEEVGLGGRAQESVHLFSGGQQQRVLIARALVRRPRLLIIDEPLSGIDGASKVALAASLERLHGAGATILVVLHELGELGSMIQRAVVLDQGTVVSDGLPSVSAPHEAGHHHPDARPPAIYPVPDLNGGWQQ